MRILFTSVPAYGHLLPLAPLMAAAVDRSHEVAFVGAENVRPVVTSELPEQVEFLPAGVAPDELFVEAKKRDGGDPFHPTPAMVGEMFGGTRLDLDSGAARAAATAFGPDLVIAEAFDSVGPIIAADLGVPWHQVGLGPGIPPFLVEEIAKSTRSRYERAGLTATAPTTYIDPCPPALQEPGWTAPARTLRVRAQAHQRSSRDLTPLPVFVRTDKPTVLLTLGTEFSTAGPLAEMASAVAEAGANVLATLGPGMQHPPATPSGGEIGWVGFIPLDQLLDVADFVVAAGGSGTVLGALSRGVPMVLCPQGADQPITAARAEAAGVAIVASSIADVAAAVRSALDHPTLRTRAREMAADIDGAPTAGAVISALVDGVRS